jgi:hypothetical protein
LNPADCAPLGEAICGHLIAEIRKLGFPEEQLPLLPVFSLAAFTSPKDPFSGQESLIGTWRSLSGERLGEIKLHGDGSFYAEYDLALPHPSDTRWFVECVVAWGRDDIIKTEARLLSALG